MKEKQKKYSKKVMHDWVIMSDLCDKLFNDDKKSTEWLRAPNDYFFGKTPAAIIKSGEGQSVIDYLNMLLGKLDKQAF